MRIRSLSSMRACVIRQRPASSHHTHFRFEPLDAECAVVCAVAEDGGPVGEVQLALAAVPFVDEAGEGAEESGGAFDAYVSGGSEGGGDDRSVPLEPPRVDG